MVKWSGCVDGNLVDFIWLLLNLVAIGIQIGESLRLVHIFILGYANWLDGLNFSGINRVSVVAFNPEFAIPNLKSRQEIDELEVLVAHQLLEYLVTEGLVDENVRFFEVWEQNNIDFFRSSADFDQVNYATDIVEVTIEDLSLLVTAGK